ncbi:uncharacterized protein LOC143340817 isoform X1 [Colletes latitarsis]|uniref:uncharacterized protein LOC143340817 isoform X1 n=1 Tax=Colletes latitarsis TaxID=2605962 RepID=UPI004036C360
MLYINITKMNELHQNILKDLRESIVADMDVFNGIIEPLKSSSILKDDHIEQIRVGHSKQEKAKILLDILPSRGPFAFDNFREALRHHYKWLSEEMDRLEKRVKTADDPQHVHRPILPAISPLTVGRERKMIDLKYCLQQLQPNEYVVLHGMKGFGKSCLTACTLKDKVFVKNSFRNEIYWIKFGYERPIDEEILIQLNKLYCLVKNLEMLPGLFKPEPLTDSLIHFLKHHFNKKKHRHALLILDDVYNSKIIDVFDFECKTLVITANLDVTCGKSISVFELLDGFTETETLSLFAKVLDTKVEILPSEAKHIHDECKGMPLLIAMFATQFEEFKHDMKLRPDRWRYYLNSLRNKDKKNRVIKLFLERQETIFNMCIDQLSIEMRKCYEELVIFREDVNITPQTLKVLWGRCTFQVEEMMLDLCHKSLAAKQWNNKLHCYMYGVHDLLLYLLRKRFSEVELVKMHKSLIEKYRKYCDGDFSKLPSDNYSYSYIGYHLEQAQLYDELPNIYLNFDFIQATIIHSGLSNLLVDLYNYREHITKNYDPMFVTQFNDLQRFLDEQTSTIVKHKYKKCLDIVQIAMNHPYEGYVKDTAIKLAKERSKNLYLSHDKKLGQLDRPCSEEISTEIRTSCFVHDPDLILIGNGAGEIFLWDSIYKTHKVFSGHDKSCGIRKIVISTEGDCFLSLDDLGIVKLFELSHDENYDQNRVLLRPREKQSFWSGIFASKIPHDDSSLVLSVDGEIIQDMTFAHDSKYIAVCTNRGTIKIWDRYGVILSEHSHNPQNSSCLKSVVFSMESNLLHVMDETHGVLISYCRYGAEYKYLSQYNPNLQTKKIIFFCNVPKQNNSLCIVTEDKAVYIKWFRTNNDHMHTYDKQIRATIKNRKIVYVCATLTYDGQYLVLADSSGFINIWNANAGTQLIATYKCRISSLDTYWLKEKGFHIICGCENRLLHKWKFPVEGITKSIRKPLFDAAVQQFGQPDVIITETSSNTIVALIGNEIIAETKPINGKICNLILSSDRKKVVFVTNKGSVSLFDIEKNEVMPILNILQNIELIKILNVQNNSIIVCRETDDNLRVWQNTKLTYLIENAGYVISIHEISEKHLLTITRNGIITLWSVNGTNWLRTDRVSIGSSDILTTFSCLSYWKIILAVLNEPGDVVLYKLQEDTITSPACIKITEYFRKRYAQKLTCCDISQEEQYLAIGFENGDISIIDISIREEIHKLYFHTTSVTQLYWAPSVIGVPVLLSVNSDEIVWWNIAPAIRVHKEKKRLRDKINRSVSSPSVCQSGNASLHMSTSYTADAKIYNAEDQLEGNTTVNGVHNHQSKYWKFIEGKDPQQPSLLAVVELPSNFFAKVCISTDFTKFVTVDIYGSISTFTLCGFN